MSRQRGWRDSPTLSRYMHRRDRLQGWPARPSFLFSLSTFSFDAQGVSASLLPPHPSPGRGAAGRHGFPRHLGLSLIDTVEMAGSLHSYWRKCWSRFDKDQRRAFDGIMIYFGGTFGMNEIEELFRTRLCSLVRWRCCAKKI